MHVIIFSEKRGRTKAFNISSENVFRVSIVLGIFLTSFLIYLNWSESQEEEDFLFFVQGQIKEQTRRVDSLVMEVEGESSAVGRNLAQVESRILRMEALSQRIAEMAELEEGEFQFDRVPPLGGPQTRLRNNLNREEKLDDLVSRLDRRQQDLRILEAIIINKQIFADSVPTGRPVKWGWISSRYGERIDPITGHPAWHDGIDFAGRPGSEVVAVASGIVVRVANTDSYGEIIEVGHGDGYFTRYAHHEEVLVGKGDVVRKGDVIALMGSSGRSTGPHVHFEVLKNGVQLDPTDYVERTR